MRDTWTHAGPDGPNDSELWYRENGYAGVSRKRDGGFFVVRVSDGRKLRQIPFDELEPALQYADDCNKEFALQNTLDGDT